jgi:hypothetical protein
MGFFTITTVGMSTTTKEVLEPMTDYALLELRCLKHGLTMTEIEIGLA